LDTEDRVLNIEVATTDVCNFRCKYCFEGQCGRRHMSLDEWDAIEERIRFIMRSGYFKHWWDNIRLTLWGGEPMLNLPVTEATLKFCKEIGAKVFVYTNGTNLREFFDWMKEEVLQVQVSYDGEPINSLMRVDAGGQPTTEQTRRLILEMIDQKIKFKTKSTIPPELFKHMPDCWRDIEDISRRAESYGHLGYGPTIDYHVSDTSRENELKTALIEIAKMELERAKQDKQYLLTWFRSTEPSFCSAGAEFFFIDIDGCVYPCHGAIYTDAKDKLRWGSVYDDTIINILEKKMMLHDRIMFDEPESCKVNPYTTYNVRCNVVAFSKSCRSTYESRWTDYTVFDPSMKYFECVSKVRLALNRAANKEKKDATM